MTELHFRSATALARSIAAGEVGARELLEHFLERIDRLNPQVNAIIVERRDEARVRADAADAAVKRGDTLGPLHGVPMTIKESYDWVGTPSTHGIPEQRDNVATTDAVAIQRLTAAGANIFGKSNVPIRLADFQSYNAIYGTTNNPWNLERTPGGSSGGSAAALAAGLTGLEIGTDIGGSIRNPAHYCGVFGHKPTWNLVPYRGHALGGVLTPTDISVAGPLARSAADLKLAMNQLAGPDVIDALAMSVTLPGLDKPLSDLRVGVVIDNPVLPTSAAVAQRVRAVAAALAGRGAQVEEITLPFSLEDSHEVFSSLLWSAMSARMPDDQFAAAIAEADKFAADDRSPRAALARSRTLRHRDWSRYNERRTKLRWAWHELFKTCDVVLTPIMPTTAYSHDHRPEGQRTITIDGQQRPYFDQTFWAGLAGGVYLPATIIPTGPEADGLPIGVQMIGPHFGDMVLIELAMQLEAMGFAFTPPPGY